MAVVSVIIPTYKNPAALQRAIESVLSQTYGEWELIVVDDGSGDAAPVTGMFPGVKLIEQSNTGPAGARNRGLLEASGEFVASLDHDDAWDSACLERAVGLLTHASVDFAWVNFRIAGDTRVDDFALQNKDFSRLFNQRSDDPLILVDGSVRELFAWPGPASNSALVFRRANFAGWVSESSVTDDWLMMSRFLHSKTSVRAGLVRVPSWTKWHHPENFSVARGEARRKVRIADLSFGLRHYGSIFSRQQRRRIASEIAGLHCDIAYDCSSSGRVLSAARSSAFAVGFLPDARTAAYAARTILRSLKHKFGRGSRN